MTDKKLKILGPDTLVFGVDDVAACLQYLTDYGLKPVNVTAAGGLLVAADGTGVEIWAKDAKHLPPPVGTTNMLRKTTYGVGDKATLDAVAAEIAKDREVRRLSDGTIEFEDDTGFTLGFQLTVRKPIDMPAETVNAPGAPAQRPANVIAVDENAVIVPRSLSHVVYFVPDVPKAEAFYIERLGFRVTDRFLGVGPFMQSPGSDDHHCIFLLQTPPFMKGVEHFTFHMAGPTEVMQAGTRFVDKGYQSFWGPGRHKFGSNWFWYFNSPLGCHVEYDADMDLHDDSWVARETPINADASQVFLFRATPRWSPGGPPPPGEKPH